MKIAVVFAGPWIPGSVDMTEYVRVLQSLGHQATFICQDRSEGPADFPTQCVDLATLEDSSFYRRQQLDAAIAFTWINSPRIIMAMKNAGMRVLLRGDNDGMISIRRYPRHHIRARLAGVKGIRQRGGAIKHCLQRYFFDYRVEDRDRMSCIEHADATVLETAEATRHLTRILEWYGRGDLVPRVHVAPHFISSRFLTGDVPRCRQESVACIARWEDAQKNAPLLAKAIALHLSHRPGTIFNIVGTERGRSEFSGLTARFPQVRYLGPQTPHQVRRILESSQVLFSASRWEGAPLVANEALSLGATIVGTPICAFIEVCFRGAYGTVARNHSAKALAAALSAELDAWNSGQRDPVAIAAYWRPHFSSAAVVSRLVDLLAPPPKTPGQPPLASIAS